MSGETQNGKMSAEELERALAFLEHHERGAFPQRSESQAASSIRAHIAAIQREAEAERARADAMREALEGLVAAVVKDSNEHGISGYTGARLSDARAALSQARGEPSLSSANPE